jgi:cytochrome c6
VWALCPKTACATIRRVVLNTWAPRSIPMIDRMTGALQRVVLGMTVAGLAILAVFYGATTARAGKPDDDAGKKIFEANCAACHGSDGAGTPVGLSLMAPDLRSDAVQKLSDDDLKKQVSEGKNNMPPFKDTLSTDQIQAVVAYVRTFAKKS